MEEVGGEEEDEEEENEGMLKKEEDNHHYHQTRISQRKQAKRGKKQVENLKVPKTNNFQTLNIVQAFKKDFIIFQF